MMLVVYIGVMPGDVGYAALAVPSRRRLLHVLRNVAAPADIKALAADAGLHANTVRFHLDVLVKAGLVVERTERRGARGRPRTTYEAAVPAEAAVDGYRLLAGVLTQYLDQVGEGGTAERAGRAWARRLLPSDADQQVELATATRRVVALFAQMGFEPEAVPHGQGSRVLLRACPFRELAEEHPGVVCALHLGVLRGALDQAMAGRAEASLRPFVEPRLCVAEIASAEEVAQRSSTVGL
jgi:predicted ArsR family transcriptional regulator